MPITPDVIEKFIDIDADVERVYALASRPGWWISDGTITENVLEVDGDVTTVTHPKYGSFRIKTVLQDPPSYVAFSWLGGDHANEGTEGTPTTLVEFWIEERSGGGSTLRVRESGFQSLSPDEAVRRRNYEDNLEGWVTELAAARTHVEAGGVSGHG